jgi:hypothetical protein
MRGITTKDKGVIKMGERIIDKKEVALAKYQEREMIVTIARAIKRAKRYEEIVSLGYALKNVLDISGNKIKEVSNSKSDENPFV